MRSEAFRKSIIRIKQTPAAKSAPFWLNLSCAPLLPRFMLLACLHQSVSEVTCKKNQQRSSTVPKNTTTSRMLSQHRPICVHLHPRHSRRLPNNRNNIFEVMVVRRYRESMIRQESEDKQWPVETLRGKVTTNEIFAFVACIATLSLVKRNWLRAIQIACNVWTMVYIYMKPEKSKVLKHKK